MRRFKTVSLGVLVACLMAGLIGSSIHYVSVIDDKDKTIDNLTISLRSAREEVSMLKSMASLWYTAEWLQTQTIRQPANSYSSWTCNADYAGHMCVWIESSSTNTTYVRVIWSFKDGLIKYDNQIRMGTAGEARFPILPSTVEIRVGNTNTIESATETVRIMYWY